MVHTQRLADKGVGVPSHSCEGREIGRRPCSARLARRCPGRASDCERGRKRLTSASPSERSEQSQIARAAKTRAQQQDWYVIVVLELPEVSIPHAYSRVPLPQRMRRYRQLERLAHGRWPDRDLLPLNWRPRASSSLVKRSKTRSRSSGCDAWAVVADADHGPTLINSGGLLPPAFWRAAPHCQPGSLPPDAARRHRP